MFDSTALLGLFPPFRLVAGDRNALSFWVCRAAELLADWVFIVTLLVAVFGVTSDIAVVALFMLLRVVPRAVVAFGLQDFARRIGPRSLFLLSLPRIPLIASLALIDGRSDLIWAGAVVTAYGLLMALSNQSRAAMLPNLVPRPQLACVIQLNAAIERITFVAGPLLAALILWGWNVETAFVASAVAFGITSLLLRTQIGTPREPLPQQVVQGASAHGAPSWNSVRRQPTLLLLAGGLFTGAALAICLKVVLVELATEPLERSDAMLGVLVALVGTGTLLGPLSVPRLLGHMPISLIVTGSVMGISAGIVLISVVTRLEIVALVLLGIGMISITNDMVTATAIRRIAPEADLPGTGQLMLAAIISGQLVAALAVALLARVWDITAVMLAVGIASALLMTVLFAAADGVSLVTRKLARW
ncbi:MAG TPA: MFS transporter [Thermomicrobiales bacterium]|nr:MFS transporter [Thermomicrobiales bacterium]